MSKKFKSLLEFLEGPVWNTPIMTFIEVKSAVFSEEEDHESEYQIIFNDYKRLVDTMLGTYLEDMNITPEQFEEECKEATDSKMMTSFRQSLFEQVWAAENFEIFKRMMTQKNVELELQVLSVLQYDLGIKSGEMAPQEDVILQRVLKQSAEEHEMRKKQIEKMDADYKKAMEETLKEAVRLDSQYQQNKAMMEKVIKLSIEDSAKKDAKSMAAKSAPTKTRSQPALINKDKRKSYPLVGATKSLGDKPGATSPNDATVQKRGVIDEEALILRKKYLCEQRDRLVKQKKVEREKYLNELDTSKRPKSSRVARSYMADKMDSKTNVDPKTLRMRKALAQCLKEELINQ